MSIISVLSTFNPSFEYSFLQGLVHETKEPLELPPTGEPWKCFQSDVLSQILKRFWSSRRAILSILSCQYAERFLVMSPKIKLIVAACENGGIGSKGSLPWRLKEELKYFSRITRHTSDKTKCNAVIMGRRTWESIPVTNRPLAKRRNIILSSQSLVLPEGVELYHSLDKALSSLDHDIETAWIIGGSSLYKEALDKKICDQLYITRIFASYDCDVFLPEIGDGYILTRDPDVPEEKQEENGISYKYEVYERKGKNMIGDLLSGMGS